jgi:hypothetical protein
MGHRLSAGEQPSGRREDLLGRRFASSAANYRLRTLRAPTRPRGQGLATDDTGELDGIWTSYPSRT